MRLASRKVGTQPGNRLFYVLSNAQTVNRVSRSFERCGHLERVSPPCSNESNFWAFVRHEILNTYFVRPRSRSNTQTREGEAPAEPPRLLWHGAASQRFRNCFQSFYAASRESLFSIEVVNPLTCRSSRRRALRISGSLLRGHQALNFVSQRSRRRTEVLACFGQRFAHA